jgi:hypothetical protein
MEIQFGVHGIPAITSEQVDVLAGGNLPHTSDMHARKRVVHQPRGGAAG